MKTKMVPVSELKDSLRPEDYMKKYSVLILRTASQSATVVVEAENLEEAKVKALKTVCESAFETDDADEYIAYTATPVEDETKSRSDKN